LLLLILFWLPGATKPQGRRVRELKDHQKLFAGTARDYSTPFRAGCKHQIKKWLPQTCSLLCYHSSQAKERTIRGWALIGSFDRIHNGMRLPGGGKVKPIKLN
jgi:hypothetical protein